MKKHARRDPARLCLDMVPARVAARCLRKVETSVELGRRAAPICED